MTSRVDMHCHLDRVAFLEAGRSALAGAAGVRDAADHTEIATYAGMRSRDGALEALTRAGLAGPAPAARRRCRRAARERSWERSMGQLAAGYRRALDAAAAARPQTLARVA